MEDWKFKPASDMGLTAKERLRSLRRESGLIGTMSHLLWWGGVRLYLRLYHRFEACHLEHLPKQPPFVLAANHSSHLDALALAAPLPWRLRDRVFPIAAGDTFFKHPATATFAAFALNALPIWRRQVGAHSLEILRDRLIHEPCAYILFPEGTRSRTGEMSLFKPGLGSLVAGTGVPVVPCFLSGTFHAMPPGKRLPRPVRIRLTCGPPLRFSETANDRSGWTEVARQLELQVRALAMQSAERGEG